MPLTLLNFVPRNSSLHSSKSHSGSIRSRSQPNYSSRSLSDTPWTSFHKHPDILFYQSAKHITAFFQFGGECVTSKPASINNRYHPTIKHHAPHVLTPTVTRKCMLRPWTPNNGLHHTHSCSYPTAAKLAAVVGLRSNLHFSTKRFLT